MPIFEFRCLQCGKLFEKLFLDQQAEIELKCPRCGADSLDRVISRANPVMGTKGKKTTLTTKSCSPGSSCMTLEVPGAGD
ncbi:MAG TPA: zinc ribbon domain-containing protein [Desulfotomaculum sp.]|nr:zinc ribbon domain-containing protein [Desulfotomaculum sp.]